MSRNTKIILGVVIGILLLCGAAVIVGVVGMTMFAKNVGESMFVTDPEKIAEQASRMLEYDLPSGYSEQVFMNMVVGKILVIAKSDMDGRISGSMIMVMQLAPMMSNTDEMSQEEMQRQLMDSMKTQTGEGDMDLELVGSEDVQIAGQETVLYTYEGVDSDGDEVRVVSGLFEMNGKKTMVMALGARADWPAEDIDAFIQSIR